MGGGGELFFDLHIFPDDTGSRLARKDCKDKVVEISIKHKKFPKS